MTREKLIQSYFEYRQLYYYKFMPVITDHFALQVRNQKFVRPSSSASTSDTSLKDRKTNHPNLAPKTKQISYLNLVSWVIGIYSTSSGF
jgi:hypothetical protein